MRKVETDVLNAHHHALARVGLWQRLALICGPSVQHFGCGVHQYAVALAHFDAANPFGLRQLGQLIEGDVHDVDVAKLR